MMVVSFWALMAGLFVKTYYLFDKGAYGSAGAVLLDKECRMGVYYGGKRIGEFNFSAYPRQDERSKGYRLVSRLGLEYAPIGEAYVSGESLTDEKLFLREFSYYLRYELKMFGEQDARLEGRVQGDRLLFKVKWGNFEKAFNMPAEDGISLYDPITPWIFRGKLRPGDEYTVGVLNRLTRRHQLARVKVLRKIKIPFEGKEVSGFEVETTVEDLKSIFWVGGDGKVYRMESPVGFSLVREPITVREKLRL